MVQSVSSRLRVRIYEARRRFFHTVFNTNVEKLIGHSQSVVPKLILTASQKGSSALQRPLHCPRKF
jgi:hypothetical protein